MANFLVTGGSGFIGSNLVAELISRGENVRVLDNFSTGRRENIQEFIGAIDLIEGDLRDIVTVRESVRDMDYVLHLGALPSVPRSVRNPITTNEVNINGTLHVLIASRDAGVKRVIYASSSSIYGESSREIKSEDLIPNPRSPYSVSKLAGEHYCQVFCQVYGVETVCLRYFNVFGPRQDPSSQYSAVIPKFILAFLKDQPPVIYGDGLQSRDFTYVGNVVKANLLAIEAQGIAGQVINIASGVSYTLLELVDLLNKILGKNIKPVFAPARLGEIKHSSADISKAHQTLKYRVETDFETGLRETIRWFSNQSTKHSIE